MNDAVWSDEEGRTTYTWESVKISLSMEMIWEKKCVKCEEPIRNFAELHFHSLYARCFPGLDGMLKPEITHSMNPSPLKGGSAYIARELKLYCDSTLIHSVGEPHEVWDRLLSTKYDLIDLLGNCKTNIEKLMESIRNLRKKEIDELRKQHIRNVPYKYEI